MLEVRRCPESMGLKFEKDALAKVVEKLSKFTKSMVKEDGEMIPTVFYSVGGKETALLCYAPKDMHGVITTLRKSQVDWLAMATTGWMSDTSNMDSSDSPDRKRVLVIQARMGEKTHTVAYEVIKNRNRFTFKETNIPRQEKAKGYLAI